VLIIGGIHLDETRQIIGDEDIAIGINRNTFGFFKRSLTHAVLAEARDKFPFSREHLNIFSERIGYQEVAIIVKR